MCDEIRRVTADFIQDLAKHDPNCKQRFLSPVNLALPTMTKIQLPELKWLNMESDPSTTRIANTGQTVIVSGSWAKNRPRLRGGPLLVTYVFFQLHYHWGSDSTHGSEHSYNGTKTPLEMHAIFIKESCIKIEDAMSESDGVVVISYAYKLDEETNPGINLICNELQFIPNPNQMIELADPAKLISFINPFTNDYFMYWGSVRANVCKHILLWMLCRQPYIVNEKQLDKFRSLFTSGNQQIMNNSRNAHIKGFEIFHVNPSTYTEDVLYKKTQNNTCRKVIYPEKIKANQQRKRTTKRTEPLDDRSSSISSSDSPLSGERSSSQKKLRTYSYSSSTSQDSCVSTEDTNKQTRFQQSLKEKKENVQVSNTTNTKGKFKRESIYSKYFSSRDKEESIKNKVSNVSNEKENVTVMNVNTKALNVSEKQPSRVSSNESGKILSVEEMRKEKNTLKNIKHNYLEARTKFKKDVLLNNSTSDPSEVNLNTLKYINLQKMATTINENNAVTISSSKDEITPLPSDFSGQSHKLKEKEVKFSDELNTIPTNIFTYAVTSEFDGTTKSKFTGELNKFQKGDDPIEETDSVHRSMTDKGINTIPFDELIYSLNLETSSTKTDYQSKLKAANSAVAQLNRRSRTNLGQLNLPEKMIYAGRMRQMTRKPLQDTNQNKVKGTKPRELEYLDRKKTQIPRTPVEKSCRAAKKEQVPGSMTRSVSSSCTKVSNDRTNKHDQHKQHAGFYEDLAAKSSRSKKSIKSDTSNTKSDHSEKKSKKTSSQELLTSLKKSKCSLQNNKPDKPKALGTKQKHKISNSETTNADRKGQQTFKKHPTNTKIPLLNRSKSNVSSKMTAISTTRPLTPGPGRLQTLSSEKSSLIPYLKRDSKDIDDKTNSTNLKQQCNETSIPSKRLAQVTDESKRPTSRKSTKSRESEIEQDKILQTPRTPKKKVQLVEEETSKTNKTTPNVIIQLPNDDKVTSVEDNNETKEFPNEIEMLYKDCNKITDEITCDSNKITDEITCDSNEITADNNSTTPTVSTVNNEDNINKLNKTRVFNKIPLKTQKPTPVHTWRY